MSCLQLSVKQEWRYQSFLFADFLNNKITTRNWDDKFLSERVET
jgi:hypothetical protein